MKSTPSTSNHHTVLRPQSNEKIAATMHLNTNNGGSQSFNGQIMRKPNLKLNTNMIN